MGETTDPNNGQSRRASDDRLAVLERSHEALRAEIQGMMIQLTETVAEVRGWRGNQEHMMEELKHTIHRLDMAIYGDGTTMNPGLVVGFDRLKNNDDARTWHIRTLWASVVGVIAAWFSSFFGRHP